MHEFQEYPKWLHRHGHASVLVEDAEEEAAIRDKWTAVEAPAVALHNQLLCAAAPAHSEGNQPAAVPGKAGWPKGKKRGSRSASVN